MGRLLSGSIASTIGSGAGAVTVYIIGATTASLFGPVLLVGAGIGVVVCGMSWISHSSAGDTKRRNMRLARDAGELREMLEKKRRELRI